jgi:transcription-repair coupling factor (superfamily II helicase)
MQLKAIHETFLPDMLRNEFGKEIFKNIETHQHISVKGFAGSSPSVFAAELFLTQKKTILFIIEDKEEALYVTSEMEEKDWKRSSSFRILVVDFRLQ